jgi:biotin carboxyl carrier protein
MKNLKITVNGTPYDVQVEEMGGAAPVYASPAGAAAPAAPAAPAPKVNIPAPAAEPAPAPKAAVSADAELISCPMPGTIVSVNVQPGQSVKKSDVLVILEAMKMENEIMAPHDAIIAAVHVNKGDSVNSGSPLVSLQ